IRPAVASGGLLVGLYTLSDFGAGSIVRTDTFTRAIFTAFNLGFNRTAALVLSTLLVVLTVLVLAGESATRRSGTRVARVGGGAGRPPVRLRLRVARWPAAAGMAALAALALGVPAVSLTRWFTAGVSRPGSLAEIGSAAVSSLWVSALGAVLTVALALPIGLLTARAPGRVSTVVDRLSYVTHALPGV